MCVLQTFVNESILITIFHWNFHYFVYVQRMRLSSFFNVLKLCCREFILNFIYEIKSPHCLSLCVEYIYCCNVFVQCAIEWKPRNKFSVLIPCLSLLPDLSWVCFADNVFLCLCVRFSISFFKRSAHEKVEIRYFLLFYISNFHSDIDFKTNFLKVSLN